MAKPKESYDPQWRKDRFAEIDDETKIEWNVKLRDLCRKCGRLSVDEMADLMEMEKWLALMVLSRLLDTGSVKVLDENENGVPTEIAHKDFFGYDGQ